MEAERLTCKEEYLDAGSLGVWKYLVESLDLRCSSLFLFILPGRPSSIPLLPVELKYDI